MSAELPLSTTILLVLNPSIFNIMTNGSLWGCFTPLASASLKDISWSVRLCLNGDIMWMLFNCLWHSFLRDLNNPPVKASVDDRHSWKWIHASFCCPPLNLLYSPSSHISAISPFVSILLSAPLSPENLPCNSHDLCGNSNTYSYRGCGVMNVVVSAI